MQYFKTTPPLDAVDNKLNFISIRWKTDGGLGHTTDARGNSMIESRLEKGVAWFRSLLQRQCIT